MLEHFPKIIGHRGAAGYAPENTIASFEKAAQLGVSWVEFDVMLAGCGELVVIHDQDLERTTNGKGKVAQTPYTEIAKLDAGSWFSSAFAGQTVPTFNAVIACLGRLNLNANVEIKPAKGLEVQTTQKVLKPFMLPGLPISAHR